MRTQGNLAAGLFVRLPVTPTSRASTRCAATFTDDDRSRRCRVFRLLRQIIGDLEPRHLAADEDVACWPHWRIIQDGKRDAVLS